MRHSSISFVVCSVLSALIWGGNTQPLHAGDEGFITLPNPVFVTSVTGTGDLSTWADAGGFSGLAAADNICRARALAAGLDNANLYVAWLSDSSDDAYCRIHGMSGTKASNCSGFPSLPSFAGPWARIDGHPFATDIFNALSFIGEVYVPALLTEFGVAAASTLYFTATDDEGVYDPIGACDDWTSNPVVIVRYGSALRTKDSWSGAGWLYCDQDRPLLCMLPGDGPALTPLYNQGALAFVSSSTGTGRLEDWPEAGGYLGLAAADNICLLRAMAAGLPHPEEFKAWLSTSTVNATDRFTFGGPWVRPDGVFVAQTKAELVSGRLHAPINQGAFGEYRGNAGVWTGSTGTGVGGGSYCNDWVSDNGGDAGSAGTANSVDQWSEYFGPESCSETRSLYCLSNVPSAIRIFFDSFETGDLTSWSVTQP